MPKLPDFIKRLWQWSAGRNQLISRSWRIVLRERSLLRFILRALVITLAGTWLSFYFQTQSWIRERQFEVFRKNYEESLLLIDELAEMTGRRAFGLNQVLWVAKGTGTGDLEQVWDDYYVTARDWNVKLRLYKIRIDRSIGREQAELLQSASEEGNSDGYQTPKSIHGNFRLAHTLVREYVDSVKKGDAEDVKKQKYQQALEAINRLSFATDIFFSSCLDAIYVQVGESRERRIEDMF